jgi:hypothetical protein
MDITKILDKIEKYHFIGCGIKKCKIISSSDTKSEAKLEAINFLKDEWDDFIDVIIFMVTIKKSKKNEWNKEKNFLLHGPIIMVISEYIICKNKKLKATSSGINPNVFFSETYLKKNKKILEKDIVSSIVKYKNGELKQGLTEKNVL